MKNKYCFELKEESFESIGKESIEGIFNGLDFDDCKEFWMQVRDFFANSPDLKKFRNDDKYLELQYFFMSLYDTLHKPFREKENKFCGEMSQNYADAAEHIYDWVKADEVLTLAHKVITTVDKSSLLEYFSNSQIALLHFAINSMLLSVQFRKETKPKKIKQPVEA